MYSTQNSNTYFENSIKTASPAKLIELLYKNAIERIDKSIKLIDEKKFTEANKQILRIEDIVLELNVSLNIEKGGEIANNLRALYNYIYRRLIEANTKKDIEILKEVKTYLEDLLNTWKEVMKKEINTVKQLNASTLNPKFDIQYWDF